MMGEPTQPMHGEGRRHSAWGATRSLLWSLRGSGDGMSARRGSDATRETPGGGCVTQPGAREGQAGPPGESERSIVPTKPANTGGGKGPWFKANARSGDSREIGVSLLPPTKVGKLQEALHAKAKSAPRYRFYALYDKVYRADVLGYALQCCRANGGSAGVDGQTFEDIEA